MRLVVLAAAALWLALGSVFVEPGRAEEDVAFLPRRARILPGQVLRTPVDQIGLNRLAAAGDKEKDAKEVDFTYPDIDGEHDLEDPTGKPFFKSEGIVKGFTTYTPTLFSYLITSGGSLKMWMGEPQKQPASGDSDWKFHYKPGMTFDYDQWYTVYAQTMGPDIIGAQRVFKLVKAENRLGRKTKPKLVATKWRSIVPTKKGMITIESPEEGVVIRRNKKFHAVGRLHNDIRHHYIYGVLFHPLEPDKAPVLGEVRQTGKNFEIVFRPTAQQTTREGYILRIGTLDPDVYPEDVKDIKIVN
jgi:hypothetical protein